jgi:hypothetical protein
MLAGDLIIRALENGGSAAFGLDDPSASRDDDDQGGTDPGNIAEFLAFDIAFEVEPAIGLIFPAQVER